MKKYLIFVLAVCLLLGMVGCGNTPDTNPSQSTSGNEATGQPDIRETEPQQSQENQEYAFVYNGVEIRLHAPAAPIVSALGEPKNYTEETSCAFEGLDKTYYYGSFYLDTYPKGEEDYVFGFWFADDGVTTQEGIYIGCTQAQVEAAYGTEGYNGTNAYILTKGSGKLTVILEDGVVTSIQYEIVME